MDGRVTATGGYIPAMFRLLRSAAAALLAMSLGSCAFFGNLNFYSDAELEPLSVQAYAEATQQHGEVTGTADAAMVQRVAAKIAAAANEKGFAWEARLLRADDTPNAFCLPNGRIAIYTGILRITEDEHGLAAVMGHEVAHAVLRHGGKRMTQGIVAAVASAVAEVGLANSELDAESKGLLMTAVGATAQYGVLLPYSREHETEADVLGLRYAIRAGYDPNAAPLLWERMAKLGGKTPEWMSTHPDPLKRAENLRKLIPQLVAEEKGGQPE